MIFFILLFVNGRFLVVISTWAIPLPPLSGSGVGRGGRVGAGWEEGEGLERGGKRGKGWSWWLKSYLDNCPSFDDVLTKVSSHPPTSLIRCLFIYLFRFAIVKFVVKIFLHYLIPLNPSVFSDSTSLSSSPHPHPHPCCHHPHPHPHPFPHLIRGIFASEGHWEQQADLCPKPTFAYEYD